MVDTIDEQWLSSNAGIVQLSLNIPNKFAQHYGWPDDWCWIDILGSYSTTSRDYMQIKCVKINSVFNLELNFFEVEG